MLEPSGLFTEPEEPLALNVRDNCRNCSGVASEAAESAIPTLTCHWLCSCHFHGNLEALWVSLNHCLGDVGRQSDGLSKFRGRDA